jgi:lysozyme
VATTCLNKDIADTVKLTDNQFGAIASWAFNAGCTNARRSTLIRRLNNGDDPGMLVPQHQFSCSFQAFVNFTITATVISQELPKWNRGENGVLPGLTARRAAEVALAQIPSTVYTYPCNDPDNDGDPGDPGEGTE